MLSNAGDVGSIPGWGTKVPHILGKLSLSTPTKTQQINNKFLKIDFFKLNEQTNKQKGGTEFDKVNLWEQKTATHSSVPKDRGA